MRQIFVITILTLLSINLFGQGCGLVSGTKDKKTGIETKSGVVSSKDFYSLLIQKKLDPNDSLNYRLFLHAASRVILSDSLINSKGTFELYLTNGERIVIENAECENDPLGFGASIGFTVMTTEETLMQIIESPIQKVKVFGMLETEFSRGKQKQQKKILTCLKNEK